MANHFLSVPVGYCVNNIAVTVQKRGDLVLSDAVVAEGITDVFVAEAFGSLDDTTIQAYLESFISDLKAIILHEVNKNGTYNSSGSRSLCVRFPDARWGACSDTQQDVVADVVRSLFPPDSEYFPIFGGSEQVSELFKKYDMKWFTDNISEQLDFIHKVLLPEAILLLHMAVLRCTRDKVEHMLGAQLRTCASSSFTL